VSLNNSDLYGTSWEGMTSGIVKQVARACQNICPGHGKPMSPFLAIVPSELEHSRKAQGKQKKNMAANVVRVGIVQGSAIEWGTRSEGRTIHGIGALTWEKKSFEWTTKPQHGRNLQGGACDGF